MKEKLMCVTSENFILGNQKKESMILISDLYFTEIFLRWENIWVFLILGLVVLRKHFSFTLLNILIHINWLGRIHGRGRGDLTTNILSKCVPESERYWGNG